MSDEYLIRCIDEALMISSKKEYLGLDILRDFNLVRSFEMERIIHQPKTFEEIEKAKDRLIFDELFRFCLIMQNQYLSHDNTSK